MALGLKMPIQCNKIQCGSEKTNVFTGYCPDYLELKENFCGEEEMPIRPCLRYF